MPRGDPRLAPVPVRLTVAEKGQLQTLAALDGISLSEAARRAIQGRYRINSPDLNRKEREYAVTQVSRLRADLLKIGGLYAMQAKDGHPVAPSLQADLEAAIVATRLLTNSLLK